MSADIANELRDAGQDIVYDYDLSMSCREVELDSIDFDVSEIKDIVANTITHYIKTRKTEAAA